MMNSPPGIKGWTHSRIWTGRVIFYLGSIMAASSFFFLCRPRATASTASTAAAAVARAHAHVNQNGGRTNERTNERNETIPI